MYLRNPNMKADTHTTKLHWWMEQSARISREPDKIYGVPTHNLNAQMDSKQMKAAMDREAEKVAMKVMPGERVEDPRSGLDEAIHVLRASASDQQQSTVIVEEPAELPTEYQFAHTRHHKKRSEEKSVFDTVDGQNLKLLKDDRFNVPKDNKVERDINAWLRSKYKSMESERLRIIAEMEVECRAQGSDWNTDRIPLDIRDPIYLDDDGNRLREADGVPVTDLSKEKGGDNKPAEAGQEKEGTVAASTSPAAAPKDDGSDKPK
jgi:hypothetical protein